MGKMTMTAAMEIQLTEFEMRYISIVGKRFGVHGRSEVMGQIFALLNLRARSSETALSQQVIAKIIGKSLSTVSRTLKRLFQGGYCSYVLEDNEQERAERRYHAKYDYMEFLLARFSTTLKEASLLVDDLIELKHSVPGDRTDEDKQLLDQIDHHIDQTKVTTKILEKLQKELVDDFDNR